MCWVTLTPSKGKKRGYRPTSDSSCVEDIVRVHHNPASPRLTNVRVKAPSLDVEVDEKLHAHVYPHLQHHHRHPHLHPLHMHPIHGEHHLGMSFGLGHHHHHHGGLDMSEISDIKLQGHGRKRSIPSTCPPPPPSTCPPPAPSSSSSSSSPSSPPPSSQCPPSTLPHDTSPLIPPSIPSLIPDPIYRTQIIQPPTSRRGPNTVRETTRIALRTSTAQHHSSNQRPRQNLRRVAGYQVLGRQVPWDWDCVSSTVDGGGGGGSSSAGSGARGGKWVRRKSGGGSGALKYPPFGPAEKWM